MELAILAASILAALFTHEIGTVRGKGVVRASAITGLLFGLPAYALSGMLPASFSVLPAAAMGASFAGMSQIGAIASRFWVAVSAVIFSAVFLFSSPAFAGDGGGLGTAAFVSVIITLGIKHSALIAKRVIYHA
jgi:hypothetical protein